MNFACTEQTACVIRVCTIYCQIHFYKGLRKAIFIESRLFFVKTNVTLADPDTHKPRR